MQKRKGSNIYNRWRPRTFAEFVGNERVVIGVRRLLEREDPPRSWMFVGPSGTGKTTMARVIAAFLNCEVATKPRNKPCGKCKGCRSVYDESNMDYYEINAAEKRGIDSIRDLITNMRYAPHGKVKVYCIDEVHQLTADAANALLKVFEDGIGGNYVILCTTEPNKVLPTLRTRAVTFAMKEWTLDEATTAAEEVFAGEGFTKISEGQISKFVQRMMDIEQLSPRAFLNAIDEVISSGSLAVLSSVGGFDADTLAICRAVASGDWDTIRRIVEDREDLDSDRMRAAVCGFLRKRLLAQDQGTLAAAYAEALILLAWHSSEVTGKYSILGRIYEATEAISKASNESD